VTEKPAAPRRGAFGYFAWAFTALATAVTLAHALRSGKGWGMAAASVAMFLGYAFLPRIEGASARSLARRRQRANGTVTIDDWGVTRVAGDLREAVAWTDLAWVRIYTTSDRPGADDVFFALGGPDGKGCLVPNGLAVTSHLLAALQECLPGFDNMAVAMAMGSTSEAVFTLWTRPDRNTTTTATH
jgi:hypothetical protein